MITELSQHHFLTNRNLKYRLTEHRENHERLHDDHEA